MSIELVARAKKTRLGGDSTAKLLLIVLADYANDEGMAWPSVRTLTDEVEKQDRQIQRALRKLEEEGLIRLGDQTLTRNYPKGQRPTVYEVLPDKPRRRARGTGVTHDTSTGDMHDTPTGVTHDTSTPVTHDTTPVSPTTPPRCHPRRLTGVTHDTQTVIETTNKPSRESTRASKTEKPRTGSETEFDRRVDRLIALTPDETHLALAARYGLDADLELEKFRDRCRAEGKPPADPKAAFRNWLRRAPELGIGVANPPSTDTTALAGIGGVADADGGAELTRRARKLLESSRPIRRRIPERAARLELVPGVARLLGRGMSPVDIVNLIASGGPQELSDAGIELDDLEAIA